MGYLNDIPLAFVRARLLFDSNARTSDLVVEHANNLFFDLVEETPANILGHKLSEFSPDFAEINEKYLGVESILTSKKNPFARLDVFITSKQKWFEVFIQTINESTYTILINDFTERKNKEFQLRADQEKFKDLYNNATIGIYRAKPNGNILMANKAMYSLMDFDPEAEVKDDKAELKIDFNDAIYQDHFKKNIELIGHVSKWKTKSGRRIFVRESVKPVFNIDKELIYIEGTVENITEEKIAKDQIKNLNDIFTELLVDPLINIQVIVRKTCQIMFAYGAIYNRYFAEDHKLLNWVSFNFNLEVDTEISPQDSICFEQTIANPEQVIVFEDLSETKYVETDFLIKKYKIKSYLGKAVVFDGNIIGTLCVLGKNPRTFSQTEKKIIETLAIALSHEHKRFELEKDFKISKSEAELANRAKSQFLANMSHEIRTPLNGILGFSEMLRTQESNPQKKHMLQLIEESGNQLLQIVNDIFDYSLLDTGKIPLKEGPFNLPELIETTINFFTRNANQKSLKLILESEGIEHKNLFGDYMKLNQILVNVIGNAIKFTDEGSVIIRIKTKEINGVVDINMIIEDTGIGINENQLNIVFDEFKQLDFYLTKRIKGTGLGLAITKKLVDFLQGSIYVESQPGSGSRFYINLPFQIGTEYKKDLVMNENTKQQDESASKVKILLAEDNEANQFLIKAITKSKDWEITVVDDGEQAVKAFKSNTFNLILMDVQMPVMNGYEATALIREIEKESGTHTPIVALTAYAMKSDKDQCINAGMDDYISKPFKRQEFLDMVDRSLKMDK